MEVADHPNVGLCWNSNTRFDVDEHGSVQSDFDLVKRWVRLVHNHDLTDESYPWGELFHLLQAEGYRGFCLAEINHSADPVRVMQYYRALYECLCRCPPR